MVNELNNRTIDVYTQDELMKANNLGYNQINVLGGLAGQLFAANMYRKNSMAIGCMSSIFNNPSGIIGLGALISIGLATGGLGTIPLVGSSGCSDILHILKMVEPVLTMMNGNYNMSYDDMNNQMIFKKRGVRNGNRY